MRYDEPGDQLDAWQEGRTGFPVVDAGMRQLRATGWMHNRVRMIVASFLVKDLHLEWQHGARHFLPWLVDGDLASNQHGWQWTAGLRHRRGAVLPGLQPDQQGRKFDPHGGLRPALGARAGRRRRPARALGRRPRPGRLPAADRRPRRRAPRGARPVGGDPLTGRRWRLGRPSRVSADRARVRATACWTVAAAARPRSAPGRWPGTGRAGRRRASPVSLRQPAAAGRRDAGRPRSTA